MFCAAELLGVAAGAGGMTGVARLASTMRRCRFGQAPWSPAILGSALGAAFYILSLEYFLGRAVDASLLHNKGKGGNGGGGGGGGGSGAGGRGGRGRVSRWGPGASLKPMAQKNWKHKFQAPLVYSFNLLT